MYVRGRCVDWRLLYAYPGRPSVGDLVRACGAPAPKCLPRPPISPVAALACLIPGRSAAALLPTKARLLLDDGSPIASLWWGANDAIDVDAIEAAVDATVPPTFGTPVVVDAKGRTAVRLLGDGAAAYPPLPRARGGGGRAPPPCHCAAARPPCSAAARRTRRAVVFCTARSPCRRSAAARSLYRRSAARPLARKTPAASTRPSAAAASTQARRRRRGGPGRGRGRGDAAAYQPTSSGGGGGARVPRSAGGRGRS